MPLEGDSSDSNILIKFSYPSGQRRSFKANDLDALKMVRRSQTMKSFLNNPADDLDTEQDGKRNESDGGVEWVLKEDFQLRRNKTEFPLGPEGRRKSQEGSSLFLGYINLINQSKILPKYLTPTVKLKAVEKEHKERRFKSVERDQIVRPKKLVKEVCSSFET